MLAAFNARARVSRRTAPGVLAMAFAVVALVSLSMPARAGTVAVNGSIEVAELPLQIYLQCTGCLLSGSAISSGAISGVDGTNPFEVSWTDTGSPNFSISGSYNSTCEGPAWAGAQINNGGATATVSGLTLDYNGATYVNASVKITFLGQITDAAFLPLTQSVEIDGGPQPISLYVPVLGDAGYLAAVPLTAPTLCPSALPQTLSASGTFLTLG